MHHVPYVMQHGLHRSRKTFARLDPLDPSMLKFCVADISTILEPRTAASAAAVLARFLDDAALCTSPIFSHRENTQRRGIFCVNSAVNSTHETVIPTFNQVGNANTGVTMPCDNAYPKIK